MVTINKINNDLRDYFDSCKLDEDQMALLVDAMGSLEALEREL